METSVIREHEGCGLHGRNPDVEICTDAPAYVYLQTRQELFLDQVRRHALCDYYYFIGRDPPEMRDTFSKSRWFTRGWTLQELLAPKGIVFFDATWQEIGTRTSLLCMISRATGIKDRSLRARNYNECSVAERMSWAANRQTSRIEDQAYSLLGIFGVSMPLLYGERDRAFVRLQEEIIKRSDDQSIFCWDKMISSSDNVMGLLAPHPHCFGQSKSIVYNASDPRHISTTNRGHSIEVKLAPWTVDTFVALLNCYDTYGTPKCIFLRFITVGRGFHYARVLVDGYSCANSNPGFQPMLLREMATVSSLRIVHVVDSHGLNERMKRVMAERLNGFRLDCISARDAITITDHIICGSWSKQWQAVYSEPRLESWPIAVLRLAIPGCKAKCIILGFLPMPGGRSEPAVVFTEREDTVLEVRKLLYDVPRALGDEPPPASVLRHLPPPLAFGPPHSFGSSPRRLHPSGRTSDKTWAAIMQPEQERILVTLEEGHSDADAEMYFGIEPTSASVGETLPETTSEPPPFWCFSVNPRHKLRY